MERVVLLLCLSSVAVGSFVPHLLSFAVSPLRDRACATADQAKTKACFSTFYQNFGVDPAHIPPYMNYVNDYEVIIHKYGTAGVGIICTYIDSLKKCLGPLAQSSPCTKPDSFMTMFNMDKSNASDYAVDNAIRMYECTQQQVMTDNMKCLEDIADNHMNDVLACSTAINTEIASGVPTCKAFDDYITCMVSLYVKQCGNGVKSYICNMEEIAMNVSANDYCKDQMQKC